VDDIIFGTTLDSQAYEFAEEMKQEFEMSMIGELTYFMGMQVKQILKGYLFLKLNMPKIW
jgi:hypothetical protein